MLLSVIIACFNEQEVLPEMHRRLVSPPERNAELEDLVSGQGRPG